MRSPLTLTLLFCVFHNASFAMDPFTVIMAAKAVYSVGSAVLEAKNTVDAFSDLYYETNPDAEISDEGKRIIAQIDELERSAREAGYTESEIQELLRDSNLSDKKSFESSIRSVTKAIRMGKRFTKAFSKLEQKAQIAVVETSQVEKEQLVALYKVYGAIQSQNIDPKLKEVKERLEKKNQIHAFHQELQNKGIGIFGNSNVYTAPKVESTLDAAIVASKRLRAPLMGVLLIVFFIRLIFYQFGFFGVERMGDLVRDTLICSLLLAVYPELIQTILIYTQKLADSFELRAMTITSSEDLKNIGDYESKHFFSFNFLFFIEMLKFGIFKVVEFIMQFGIPILVCFFPIVIFISQMFNFSIAWPLFLGSFLLLCLWPVMWNVIGFAAGSFFNYKASEAPSVLYSLFFSLLQIASPILGAKLLGGASLGGAISHTRQLVSKILPRQQSFGFGAHQGSSTQSASVLTQVKTQSALLHRNLMGREKSPNQVWVGKQTPRSISGLVQRSYQKSARVFSQKTGVKV